jgi:hypothetical protein
LFKTHLYGFKPYLFLDELSDDDINLFEVVALEFGKRWREYLKKPVPPKLHLLESHVPKQLWRYRRFGIFGEDPIEREHHRRKKLNILFAPIRDWEKIQRAIQSRDSRMQHPDVIQAQSLVINSTKRAKKRQSKADMKKDNKRKVKAEQKIYIQENLINTNLEY